MLRWISAVGSLGTLIACKGLVVFFAAMSAFGISMTLSDGLWATLILVFVSLALLGFLINFGKHRNVFAIVLALLGIGAVYYSYLVQFNRSIETGGIVILVIAAIVDFWALRNKSGKPAKIV